MDESKREHTQLSAFDRLLAETESSRFSSELEFRFDWAMLGTLALSTVIAVLMVIGGITVGKYIAAIIHGWRPF